MMRKQGGHPMSYQFETISSTNFIGRHYTKEFHLLMPDLQKWNSYKTSTHASTNFLPFEVSLGFQSQLPTKLPLIFRTLESSNQIQKHQANHSGIHNLS
jgi:hypothetical protein